MNSPSLLLLPTLLCTLSAVVPALPAQVPKASASSRWARGLPTDESYFPIAVWLQDPRNAARYRAAGINLYVGLWRGPTSNQLAQLREAGMPVICAQNRLALEHKDNPIIVGWMHDDEPDNAQSLGEGKGYGPPVLPGTIVRDYERMRATDPSRPVMLNLGQAVAWDNYIGRGVRRNHPEDYPEYLKGCDIASFDIYPVVHEAPEIAGHLEFVARGVERLIEWTRGEKAVWNCVECTHIGNAQVKATPEQVRTEVWMALIRGSQGLIYFVHQFKPAFDEAALLHDPAMLAGVTALNRRIHELAPVLHSPNLPTAATAELKGTIAWMLKRRADALYLFTVNMRNQPARGVWTLRDLAGDSEAEVLDESRRLAARHGVFADDFQPYQVHLYKVRLAK